MSIKLFDSELKVMEILWNQGDTSAKDIALILNEKTLWSKTTTYTVIKKCLDKGAIERTMPGFICHAAISRQDAQEYETDELINKLYEGAPDMLIASLLDRKALSKEQIERLRELVEKL